MFVGKTRPPRQRRRSTGPTCCVQCRGRRRLCCQPRGCPASNSSKGVTSARRVSLLTLRPSVRGTHTRFISSWAYGAYDLPDLFPTLGLSTSRRRLCLVTSQLYRTTPSDLLRTSQLPAPPSAQPLPRLSARPRRPSLTQYTQQRRGLISLYARRSPSRLRRDNIRGSLKLPRPQPSASHDLRLSILAPSQAHSPSSSSSSSSECHWRRCGITSSLPTMPMAHGVALLSCRSRATSKLTLEQLHCPTSPSLLSLQDTSTLLTSSASLACITSGTRSSRTRRVALHNAITPHVSTSHEEGRVHTTQPEHPQPRCHSKRAITSRSSLPR